eukprot:2148-Heterococcus_DN1.PRE.4
MLLLPAVLPAVAGLPAVAAAALAVAEACAAVPPAAVLPAVVAAAATAPGAAAAYVAAAAAALAAVPAAAVPVAAVVAADAAALAVVPAAVQRRLQRRRSDSESSLSVAILANVGFRAVPFVVKDAGAWKALALKIKHAHKIRDCFIVCCAFDCDHDHAQNARQERSHVGGKWATAQQPPIEYCHH